MKLSTQTLTPVNRFGYDGAINAIADAGFDCYDFSMFDIMYKNSALYGDGYKDVVRSVLKIAEKRGISCNQSHAPFPLHRDGDDEYNERIFDAVEKAIMITSMLGGTTCIVHPWNNWSARENAEKIYYPLISACKKYNVKIAVENMWNWSDSESRAVCCACSTVESFTEHMSLLDPEWFVACLDIGHSEMFGDRVSAVKLIDALGDRLRALHVHDNDRVHDSHTIPYFADIKWEPILAALKRNKYVGEFTYETDAGLNKFPTELFPDALRFMERIGRYMIKRIEDIRQ